jgi:hypothetical protein
MLASNITKQLAAIHAPNRQLHVPTAKPHLVDDESCAAALCWVLRQEAGPWQVVDELVADQRLIQAAGREPGAGGSINRAGQPANRGIRRASATIVQSQVQRVASMRPSGHR